MPAIRLSSRLLLCLWLLGKLENVKKNFHISSITDIQLKADMMLRTRHHKVTVPHSERRSYLPSRRPCLVPTPPAINRTSFPLFSPILIS